MTQSEAEERKRELVELAMKMIADRGKAVDRVDVAAEAGISRARVEQLFPEEDDLFDAFAEVLFEDDIAIMEEVVASSLPIRRKFYEFYARRFVKERARMQEDPALFALYIELGSAKFERIRGYIDLADHYLTELIAQAQDEGHFEGLTVDRALTLINQMTVCYTSPQMLLMLDERLAEDKLAVIVDTMFNGLSGEASKALSGPSLSIAS